MVDLVKLDLEFSGVSEMVTLFGVNEKYVKILSNLYGIEIFANQQEILLDTSDPLLISSIKRMFQILIRLLRRNVGFNERDLIYIHHILPKTADEDILDLFLGRKEIIKTLHGKPIYPKTFNQALYLDAIEKHTLTFGIGPAGTGKTYLAVLVALRKLKEGAIKRLVLTRPAVEAGENLGFLPGDLKDKVDPYLRPLYDAMYEILGVRQTEETIEKGIIEIAPLAYMRGRTLENAFVILDEAQNTTINQMKLFLTRLGFGSKMVVTGDITQSDLPQKVLSGLVKASQILTNVEDIHILFFENIDVVRHPLVQTIIQRFEDAKD
ncbi:MAG: PhoH family protein [Candidatus Izemoplasmatales bacterium]|jgi:phosphate starvation-inducible PhoH-like protein|nr:PhoH family protein [Candidatus Izemoplasmatales bacterium]MDD5601370.1 PhoH family protein [Candidatus Izemoplasmatales bacterium]MDY0373592.1 PhoH family protein [Candidatus Izemoplasmatales bacterium]NLF49278.1 PhoH family protein [Acholeplasmataceae bacterium]